MIELLVVLGIVGILSAMLFPIVGKVMETHKTSQTVTNLRNLQIANIAYAAENNGRFVPLFAGPAVFQQGWKWNTDFLNYLGVPALSRNWHKGTYSGFYSKRYPRAELGYSVYRTQNAANPWMNASLETPEGLAQPSIKHPATLIAFMDSNDWWINPWNYNNWTDREASDGQNANAMASPAYRNKGSMAAAVTYSGSVEMLSRTDLNPATPEGARRWFFDAP